MVPIAQRRHTVGCLDDHLAVAAEVGVERCRGTFIADLVQASLFGPGCRCAKPDADVQSVVGRLRADPSRRQPDIG
jgi:hypothetical protein